MGHNSERLWKPINWLADLQPFFGIVGGLGYITERAAINKWQKRKPIAPNPLTNPFTNPFTNPWYVEPIITANNKTE